MSCDYFERKFGAFSQEKRTLVGIGLSNEYYCPACRKIHKIEEGKTHEQV